ncbi:hypothetical protein PF005_g16230 [Phytophthora fragariae]|uniref:Uncharacterized protein n=1 Tax=Phytophthora fragariae TaxID=53985 RepID=A0A6A3JXE7_9STRA|nr:hypothetical protein PF003_g21696 [Phytophthora fragariae]KAE8932316.1 hypothetical protein PF009_g17647 [Phytophthora fragariae]KAE8997918.1 hypothetical protein PF011_g15272 [Phytophthora fragariae]KAE9097711.1 hypothetical protein PF007_g16531 [Phytophthora fragariae]KAE9098002.1 hypothetical protein PF010_g15737 [Phytophthora fragariae]
MHPSSHDQLALCLSCLSAINILLGAFLTGIATQRGRGLRQPAADCNPALPNGITPRTRFVGTFRTQGCC